MNSSSREQSDQSGWPADEHPIFIDAGFGHIEPSEPIVDGLGEPRRLTDGASVRADADAGTFAQAWRALLAERPGRADHWEYSVEEPQPEEAAQVSGPLPVDVALERVRTAPGARLRRRAVGRWEIMATPFPSVTKSGWAELEATKAQWHAALNEFPPSYRGSISRMGGVGAAPEAWIDVARRAAAAGFTPSDYRLLGTAHLAWTARQAAQISRVEIPPLAAIEVWAPFPLLVADGRSPLEAIEQISRML